MKRRILIGSSGALLLAYALLTAYTSLDSHLPGAVQGLLTSSITLLAFLFAVAHALVTIGGRRTAAFVGLTFGASLVFETIGVVTGRIYGPYHYTGKLGPMFLGLVPYFIPLAYFMMSYPSWLIADAIMGWRLPAGWRRNLGLAAMSAVVLTAWDVLMDPLMVRLGFWVWHVQGAYFGVPLQNYAGWLATTFVFFGLYQAIEPRLKGPEEGPPRGYLRLAAGSYAIAWLGNSIAALRLGLAGPALAGAFSIGTFAMVGLILVGSRAQPTLAV
jgi:putative membrane protein